MGILALAADERVAGVEVSEDELSVRLIDGRTISVPLVWYPRLLNATEAQRNNWQISGGGYGIHWEDIDEDLSTEGLLRGAPAPRQYLTKAISSNQENEDRKLGVVQDIQEAPVAMSSEDESEKGFLDYLAEAEEAGKELTTIVESIGQETINITTRIEQHTLNLNRLTNKPGGTAARDYRKIALLTSSDMNTFSKRIEDILPKFENNTQLLEESYSAIVSYANPESSDDTSQILSLRDSLLQILETVRSTKESTIAFRDSAISIRDQKVALELSKASNRQAKALNGVISNIELVESFALKIIFFINEKFGEAPTS
jgi:hypothetical protein